MRYITAILLGLTWGILSLGHPMSVFSEGVKTHFKEYSIFTYGDADYLCEPYEVKKDDWLYKIFRQKGEISASDFPKFLRIFKKLNQQLSNIDAIAPGIQIMIPLKQVDKETYVQKEKGIVEVPVLEFSLTFGKKEVDAFVKKHVVQSGDTVSTLLGKEFLKKGGTVSKLGEKTFTSLNPNIRDINTIYAGAPVLIPEPDILSQPWLETLIDKGYKNIGQRSAIQETASLPPAPAKPMPILSTRDISRLKRYAQLIQGTLMHQGKVFFPGKKGEPARILDLSQTPVLEENSGQKTLVLPSDTQAAALDQDLVKAMKNYWKGIRLQKLSQTLQGHDLTGKEKMDDKPVSPEKLITTLLSITPFDYSPNDKFPVTLRHIEMTVSFGRITHDSRPDILVNKGDVYGQALDTLEEQGYDILNLPQDLTRSQITLLLFSKLGYETWENPSFYAEEKVETIKGVYVNKGAERHFISMEAPLNKALAFLNDEGIQILKLDEDTGL